MIVITENTNKCTPLLVALSSYTQNEIRIYCTEKPKIKLCTVVYLLSKSMCEQPNGRPKTKKKEEICRVFTFTYKNQPHKLTQLFSCLIRKFFLSVYLRKIAMWKDSEAKKKILDKQTKMPIIIYLLRLYIFLGFFDYCLVHCEFSLAVDCWVRGSFTHTMYATNRKIHCGSYNGVSIVTQLLSSYHKTIADLVSSRFTYRFFPSFIASFFLCYLLLLPGNNIVTHL